MLKEWGAEGGTEFEDKHPVNTWHQTKMWWKKAAEHGL